MTPRKNWIFAQLVAVAAFLFSAGRLSAIIETAYTLTFEATDVGAGNKNVNSNRLNAFILKIRGDVTSNLKEISFPSAGEYWFELLDRDQMELILNVHNIKISGAGWQNVTLKWYCASSSFPPTPITPQSFLLFDASCANIEITGLTFTTTYPNTIGSGTHIKVAAFNVFIHHNTFSAAPGFAVQLVELYGTPSYCTINENRFVETWSDGLHVSAGDHIWMVGNVFLDTGDDAIGIIGTVDGNGWVSKPSTIYALANVIERSYFRGIAVLSADDVWLEDNVITGTASHGIEIATCYEHGLGGPDPVNDFSSIHPPGSSALSGPYACQRPNYAHVNGNGVSGAGTMLPHQYLAVPPTAYLPNRDAIRSNWAVNVSINLMDSPYWGRGVQAGVGLLSIPPTSYWQSSTYYGLNISNSFYGVVDNWSNLRDAAVAPLNNVSNASVTFNY